MNNECRKRAGCRGLYVPQTHLQRAQHFFTAYPCRRVYKVPPYLIAMLEDRFLEDRGVAEQVWKRIWHILATMCQTKLCTYRNEAHLQSYHDRPIRNHAELSDLLRLSATRDSNQRKSERSICYDGLCAVCLYRSAQTRTRRVPRYFRGQPELTPPLPR